MKISEDKAKVHEWLDWLDRSLSVGAKWILIGLGLFYVIGTIIDAVIALAALSFR